MNVKSCNRFIQQKRRLLLCVCIGLLLMPYAGYCLIDFLMPLQTARIAEAVRGGATEVLDRTGGLLAWRVDGADNWRVPVALEEISPWAVKSIIAAEDQRFWDHCGVDPLALARAVSQNIRHGRRVSGASTISMQAMRLLRPAKRDWLAKLRETVRALQTEQACGKETILELYLNLAPYGGNVIGIEAAARHYFGKSAKDLTLGEAALLSGIPQSPARFNPRKHLNAALERRAYVLERMVQTGLATQEEVGTALREKIKILEHPATHPAPRFADFALQKNRNRGGILNTTIDPNVQAVSRRVTAQMYPDLSQSGINGLAAVVIDVKDSSLLAMIGNANPADPVSGFVNGATAKRQPGSLLKPFLFCTAYEQGILTPASVMYDVPAVWREYRPENIDHDYMGAISAAQALRYSRNVPAVKVLQQIGLQHFSQKLEQLGLRTSGSVDKYSLSLALGTAEMSLVDLCNAYAALARGGQFKSLKLFLGSESQQAKSAFTPQAVWLTIASLSANNERSIAWKTGTSWNHRDAWAICVSPRYVIGVWCGNFSGCGNNRLVGAEAALPVALELAGRLNPVNLLGWAKPEGVRTRRVCALSGCVPSADCPHVIEASYIAGVSSQAVCTLHHVEAGTVQLCWPVGVASYMNKQTSGIKQSRKSSLKLLSPVADAMYFLPDSQTASPKRLDLSCVCSDDSTISYFLDGEFVGSSESGKTLEWAMLPGHHTLVAATRQNSIHVTFNVKLLAE